MKLVCLSFFNKTLFSLTCALVMNISPLVANAQDIYQQFFEQESERTSQLVVMITVDYNGTPTFGAGIIFGRLKDSLLIATAYHILHTNALHPNSVRIKLKAMPDTILDATILKHLNEKEMDLAVLSVKDVIKKGKCGLPFKQLGNYERKRGDDVFLVGNPNGISWAMSIEPDKIAQVSGNEIMIQSVFISNGHSGGGLLDERGHLIGMVTADKPPYGRAIDIDAVLDQMDQWKYPVDLDTSLELRTTTALHIAVDSGNIVAIKDLLANCADPNWINEDYETPLHKAVFKGNVEAMSLLLKAGASIEYPGFRSGSPLHISIAREDISAVKFLLKAGANPNGKYIYNIRDVPLGVAIKTRNIEIIKLLINAGANANAKKETETLLTFAISELKGELQFDIVKILLKAGADPNGDYEDHIGNWPLGIAIYEENIAMMELLLAAGADVNAKNKDGDTPLSFALEYKRKLAVDWLHSHGAKQ
jgi:ankyrin repeat protein